MRLRVKFLRLLKYVKLYAKIKPVSFQATVGQNLEKKFDLRGARFKNFYFEGYRFFCVADSD